MYEHGHNLNWQVWRAEWGYLSQTLLTCQIDNLCGQRIMWQLQSHPIALGHNMEDMFCSLLLLVIPSETDVRSDYNEWVLNATNFFN